MYSFLKSPNQISEQIASRVRDRRKKLKISQTELSERADVSLGSIKRFEQTGEISFSFLIKIAFALGLQDDFDLLFARKNYSSIKEIINENLQKP